MIGHAGATLSRDWSGALISGINQSAARIRSPAPAARLRGGRLKLGRSGTEARRPAAAAQRLMMALKRAGSVKSLPPATLQVPAAPRHPGTGSPSCRQSTQSARHPRINTARTQWIRNRINHIPVQMRLASFEQSALEFASPCERGYHLTGLPFDFTLVLSSRRVRRLGKVGLGVATPSTSGHTGNERNDLDSRRAADREGWSGVSGEGVSRVQQRRHSVPIIDHRQRAGWSHRTPPHPATTPLSPPVQPTKSVNWILQLDMRPS